MSSSHVVFENFVFVNVQVVPTSGDSCLFILGSFSVTEQIGPLPRGIYEVQATASECVPPPCSASTTFGVGPMFVGGIAELPEAAAGEQEAASSRDSRPNLMAAGIVVGVVAGAVALGGVGWWARRRWVT